MFVNAMCNCGTILKKKSNGQYPAPFKCIHCQNTGPIFCMLYLASKSEQFITEVNKKIILTWCI